MTPKASAELPLGIGRGECVHRRESGVEEHAEDEEPGSEHERERRDRDSGGKGQRREDQHADAERDPVHAIGEAAGAERGDAAPGEHHEEDGVGDRGRTGGALEQVGGGERPNRSDLQGDQEVSDEQRRDPPGQRDVDGGPNPPPQAGWSGSATVRGGCVTRAIVDGGKPGDEHGRISQADARPGHQREPPVEDHGESADDGRGHRGARHAPEPVDPHGLALGVPRLEVADQRHARGVVRTAPDAGEHLGQHQRQVVASEAGDEDSSRQHHHAGPEDQLLADAVRERAGG